MNRRRRCQKSVVRKHSKGLEPDVQLMASTPGFSTRAARNDGSKSGEPSRTTARHSSAAPCFCAKTSLFRRKTSLFREPGLLFFGLKPLIVAAFASHPRRAGALRAPRRRQVCRAPGWRQSSRRKRMRPLKRFVKSVDVSHSLNYICSHSPRCHPREPRGSRLHAGGLCALSSFAPDNPGCPACAGMTEVRIQSFSIREAGQRPSCCWIATPLRGSR
jgi:hypothetical protein